MAQLPQSTPKTVSVQNLLEPLASKDLAAVGGALQTSPTGSNSGGAVEPAKPDSSLPMVPMQPFTNSSQDRVEVMLSTSEHLTTVIAIDEDNAISLARATSPKTVSPEKASHPLPLSEGISTKPREPIPKEVMSTVAPSGDIPNSTADAVSKSAYSFTEGY